MRIAIDCDGVLANFVGRALSIVNVGREILYTPNDVHNLDLQKVFLADEYWNLDQACRQPGFAKSIPPYADALEFVRALKQDGHHVVIVTAPYPKSQTWCHDREGWLLDWLGIPTKDVVFAHRKHFIKADLLIEDNPAHSVPWGPNGFLVNRPWNRIAGVEPNVRVNSLFEATNIIRTYYYAR